MIPRVLVIAGSDSGGGAGIQADIKTVMALGGYATTAITAITAQNTLGVRRIMPVPAEMVVAQIDAVLDDIGADAIKIGMIGSAATAEAVAELIARRCAGLPLVVDPVLAATSGDALADRAARAALERLFRLATLVTPNLPELAALASDQADDDSQALAIAERSGAAVLAKGGHGVGEVLLDRLVLPDGTMRSWRSDRIATRHTHGTGCTLASAIAVGLARGEPLEGAISAARAYVRRALLAAPGLGSGHGPMGHGAAGRTGTVDPVER